MLVKLHRYIGAVLLNVLLSSALSACASPVTHLPVSDMNDTMECYPYLTASGLYGYADSACHLVIPARFRSAAPFSSTGFAIVENEGMNYRVINKKGELVVMTNEELRSIANAASKEDEAIVNDVLENASTARDFDAYFLKDTVRQLVILGSYTALDKLIERKLITTDLYDYDRFDNSVIDILIKPPLSSEASWDSYMNWFRSYLAKLDDINEEVASSTLLEFAITATAPMVILQAITEEGADLQRSDQYGRTLLFKVCSLRMQPPQRTTELLDWLLAEGADPNTATVEGKTPLHAAIETGKPEAVKKLLEMGADPNLADAKGETAFYYAAVGQHNAGLLETMLEFSTPDFHMLTKQGENLLNAYLRVMYAENEQTLKIVDLLLAHGADLREASQWYQKENTGVDWLVEKSADLFERVLEGGYLDVDYRDNQGNTLLHKACMYDINYEENKAKELYRKVKYLVKQGVDPQVENVEDKKAVDYAMGDNLKAKTVELLLKY